VQLNSITGEWGGTSKQKHYLLGQNQMLGRAAAVHKQQTSCVSTTVTDYMTTTLYFIDRCLLSASWKWIPKVI